MIENELPRLVRESKEANDASDEVRRRWDAREAELRAQARKTLDDELGAEFRARQDARGRADEAFRKERERVDVAAAQEKLPFPEGTVLVEWRSDRWGHEGAFRRTGAKGVLQVKRSGDPRPDNQRYDSIGNGALVVRYLTASGQPGKRCERYAKGLWKPVGEVHEKCRLAECPSCGKPRPADGAKREVFEPGSVCPNCGHVEPDGKVD